MKASKTIAVVAVLICAATVATSDPINVEAVQARKQGDAWTFSVTLRHADAGWDHYADGWEVRAPDGTVLGYRELLHPHDNEQPFTRSLGGIEVLSDLDRVIVRAHCSVDGWVGGPFELVLAD